MNFDEVLASVGDHPGWMGDADCKVLYDYASRVEGLILEIGAYAGRSTKVLALSSPKSKIVTIEPFKLGDSNTVRRLLHSTIDGLNVRHIEDTAENVGEEWVKPIDLLFVDGDHSYKAVKRNIEQFVPHLKSGSYALFHDYVIGDNGDEVRQAVNEWMGTYFNAFTMEAGIACCRKK